MKASRMILALFLLCTGIQPARAGGPGRGVASLDNVREPFVYKGTWTFGGSVSGSAYRASDYSVSSLDGIDGDLGALSVKPAVTYAVGDDLAIGMAMTYGRRLVDAESYAYSLGHEYGGAFFLRKYLPLGNSGRFSLYADATMSVTGGQSKMYGLEQDFARGSYQTSLKLALSVNPGVAMLLTPHMMLSAGVGIAGIAYSSSDQVHNQVSTGSERGFSAYYILNLFDMNVGLHYCF